MKPDGIFRFGEFQVDALARTLRREEEIVTLGGRAFDVLLYLVQNPGKVLTRDELLKNVWSDTFVDENSLAQSISVLRRAIDEKPGQNSYIATLPGRGYQFVSPVQIVAQQKETSVPDLGIANSNLSTGLLLQQTIRTSVIREEELELKAPPSRSRAVLPLVAALAAVAFAGFYAWRQVHPAPSQMQPRVISSTASATARRAVAVLGFRNLSGRPEEGWLSTALAEMLSTELVAGEKLRLVPGEDIAHAKVDLPLADANSLSRSTLARLHNDLNSDLIVLGSYTAVGAEPGTRIRLDLRLQDAVAGDVIADIAVVGNEADLFDLVSRAGSQLRERLGVEAVSPVEAVSVRASLPSNREAARLYSEGLARLRVFDALAARDLLQRAVAADPKYSLAHSAMAEAWSRLGYDKRARQEAQLAYELGANFSREERLVVEGRYREIDHEHEKAIEIYRALFTLFPDNVDYGLRLAVEQNRGNKPHDALATVESLRKLAPPASEDPRIDLEEAAAWDALGDFKHEEQSLTRAVEGAKTRGARLILARALENQCWLYKYFEQPQSAVAACRESRDIYAAAGDRLGEATALRAWADAITHTDAPESIGLYQQAQTIFRKVGSEKGEADTLNNLGNIYEALGDPATAEKMLRQALDIYRLVDDKRNMISTIGNIGSDRTDQGDLRGALSLYKEQQQLGDPANPYPMYNIAYIRQLQGDLPGAKQGYEQSLATWQKSGDQNSSAYAMWSLGNLLLQEADFSESRKMYERSLALRTSAGDTLSMAETQLGLADLSLEEGHPGVAEEAAIRQAIEVFQKQKAHDDETRDWCILARILLAEGKPAAATEAMQRARSLAAKSQNPEIRWQAAIVASRIETAEKDAARSTAGIAARRELTAVIARSRELGYQGIELEARLALAGIEMRAEQVAAGRAHLAVIEADAKAKGYNLVARKAALARG
jgi:DNA-binding winged helix-turn-helix (wHTH) protein/tetratricopeptide (TPR) repeat protein/TolB-like protein